MLKAIMCSAFSKDVYGFNAFFETVLSAIFLYFQTLGLLVANCHHVFVRAAHPKSRCFSSDSETPFCCSLQTTSYDLFFCF
ncbi:hypothetical protein HMPREF0541_01109 [Lacticaseibacillus rhamnosus ATCC 21052]|nr:hypothetical protein HMPREF0541_01109 [Lacticaseibacillus rhamnosus ATCC 21052]